MGQLFHLFESPNRFGLPAFYTLHVWAWKLNSNGACAGAWRVGHPRRADRTFSFTTPSGKLGSRWLSEL